MASINGLSLKAVKEFKGHEGEPVFQGNLYLNGKKLGFWSQDSWGGPDRFQLDAPYSQRQLNQSVIALNPEKSRHIDTRGESFSLDYDLEYLLFDLLELTQDEKDFKKAIKAGQAGILIATDGYHQTTWQLPESYTKMSDQELLTSMAERIAVAKRSFWPENERQKHEIKIYRSPDDFVVGTSIELKDIMLKRDKPSLDERIHSSPANKDAGSKNKDTDFER